MKTKIMLFAALISLACVGCSSNIEPSNDETPIVEPNIVAGVQVEDLSEFKWEELPDNEKSNAVLKWREIEFEVTDTDKTYYIGFEFSEPEEKGNKDVENSVENVENVEETQNNDNKKENEIEFEHIYVDGENKESDTEVTSAQRSFVARFFDPDGEPVQMKILREPFSEDAEYFKDAFYYYSSALNKTGTYKALVMYTDSDDYKNVNIKIFNK